MRVRRRRVSRLECTIESVLWQTPRTATSAFELSIVTEPCAGNETESRVEKCKCRFSMPCWAALMTMLVERTLPRRTDALRLCSGFVGMLLVVAPWTADAGGRSEMAACAKKNERRE